MVFELSRGGAARIDSKGGPAWAIGLFNGGGEMELKMVGPMMAAQVELMAGGLEITTKAAVQQWRQLG